MRWSERIRGKLTGRLDRSRGRYDLSSVPGRLIAIILIAIFLPSLAMTALGLLAVYRAEPIIREHVEYPFRALLFQLEQRVGQEWELRHRRLAEGLEAQIDPHRFLLRLPLKDPHVRGSLLVSTDGEVVPFREDSPFRFVAADAPGRHLREAWRLEFQAGDLAAAEDAYRSLSLEVDEDLRVEALAGLARTQAARGDWKSAVRALDLLAERHGDTIDAAGVPRGIAARLRVVELCRQNDDAVHELRSLSACRRELAAAAPWLDPDVVARFRSRLRFFEGAHKGARAGGEAQEDGRSRTLAEKLRQRGGLQRVLEHARSVGPESGSGYVHVGDAAPIVLAYYWLENEATVAYLELEPEASIAQISDFTEELKMDRSLLEVRPAETVERAATDDAERSRAFTVSRRLPRPFEHLALVYFPPPDEVPHHLSELQTIQTAGFVWAIGVLVLTLSLGILVTVRAVHKEMQLARLKTDFVSFVTHELKTPLAAIRMFAETLLMDRARDVADRQQCLEMIDREATRLSRLIESILHLSRIEKNQQVFDFSSGDMPEVVREAVRIFQEHNREGDVDIEINQAQHISRIRMDRAALVELFLNLLSNAYKYSRGETKRIVINLRESIDHIAVDVVDNGVGISKRDQRKIFDHFFRAKDYLTREVEGSGLGLSFARYIARVHNGDIKVSSTVDQGSTFTLELQKNQVMAE